MALNDTKGNEIRIETSGNGYNHRAVRVHPVVGPIEQGGWFPTRLQAEADAVLMALGATDAYCFTCGNEPCMPQFDYCAACNAAYEAAVD